MKLKQSCPIAAENLSYLVLIGMVSAGFLGIVIGFDRHVPIWNDGFGYLEDFEPKFKNESRWFTWLWFDLLNSLPPRLSLWLDLFSTGLIAHALLRPRLKLAEGLLFSLLLLLLLSSKAMIHMQPWPGGVFTTNLVTALVIYALSMHWPSSARIAAFILGSLMIGGGYQFNHFILILALVTCRRHKPYSLREFIGWSLLWVGTFVASYLFARLLTVLRYGEAPEVSRGYRVLNRETEALTDRTVENLVMIGGQIWREISGFLFSSWEELLAVLIVGLVIIGLRLSRGASADFAYKAMWLAAPPIAVLFALAFANHIYISRLNIAFYLSFVVALAWIGLGWQGIRPRWATYAISLAVAALVLPDLVTQTTRSQTRNGRIDTELETLSVLLSERGVVDTNRKLVIYDPQERIIVRELKSNGHTVYYARQLSHQTIHFCTSLQSHVCGTIRRLSRTDDPLRLCNREGEVLNDEKRPFTVVIASVDARCEAASVKDSP